MKITEKAQAHYDLHIAMLQIITDVSNLLNDVQIHNIEYEKKNNMAIDIDSWLAQQPSDFYENAVKVMKLADKMNEID